MQQRIGASSKENDVELEDLGERVTVSAAKPASPRIGQGLVQVMREWTNWSSEESHLMTLPLFRWFPGAVTAASWEQQLAAPGVRLNPVYWTIWLLTCITLLGGRLVHMPFGQHRPVRKDELDAEREARVQWIYANDFAYTVSMAMDIWTLGLDIDLFLWHRHLWDGHVGAVGTFIGVILLALTVLGNVAFFECMRKKSGLGIRACIAGNAGFAYAMSVALVGSIRKKGFKMLKMSWFMRAVAVGFAILALPTYMKLWSAYTAQAVGHRRLTILAVIIQFWFVNTCMALMFRLDHHAVWETFG